MNFKEKLSIFLKGGSDGGVSMDMKNGDVTLSNEDYWWLVERVELLSELIDASNDYSKNGTDQEKAEFLDGFRQIVVSHHLSKKEAK